MGQHAGVRLRRSLVVAVLAAGLAAATAACGDFDEAAMAGPGVEQVTADPGQLRVLRHRDDPPAGDDWRTVLAADPSVFIRTGSFREADSRDAEDHEPADVRLLYEAVEPGRTVLVLLNCASCDSGVPATDLDDTGVHVWDLVAGGGEDLSLGRTAATAGTVHETEVGDHVVVVRGPDARSELAPLDPAVLVLVARHDPSDGAQLHVDVFAAVGAGEATITYEDSDAYPVRVAASTGK